MKNFLRTLELMPSAADGVKVGKATTVELDFLQKQLNDAALRLREGLDENKSVAKLQELVPEFKRAVENL